MHYHIDGSTQPYLFTNTPADNVCLNITEIQVNNVDQFDNSKTIQWWELMLFAHMQWWKCYIDEPFIAWYNWI